MPLARLLLSTIILVAILGGQLNAQEAAGDKSVVLIFQNTTEKPVDVYWVRVEEGKAESEVLYVAGLAAGMQQEQESLVNQLWRAKHGEEIIAEIDAVGEKNQEVDIAQLKAWQSEIELVFQNTTDSDLEINWVDAEGGEVQMLAKLPVGKECILQAYPGQLWRLRQGNKVVAEYVPDASPSQVVDMKVSIAQYNPMVELVFQNTTDGNIDVSWVDLAGDEMVYAENLPPNKRHTQAAYPFQLWRIRKNQELIAEFYPDGTPTQVVDIKQLIASLNNNNAAEKQSSTPRPPKPPRPAKNNQ